MQHIAHYQRRVFLKDHQPVSQRVLIASSGKEQTLLSGTVLGLKDGKCQPWDSDSEVDCILAEDVVVPASGDVYALAYVHCSAIASELILVEGVSAADQLAALKNLRKLGIYASEA
ncbi:head decoration protein [Deltaproteobacteria bacterium Smac51]|nr:head decoration protein [Deltaproteobacteria bacterium Smac51]